MNPFTQDINRILGTTPMPQGKLFVESKSEPTLFEPYSKTSSNESEPAVINSETLSLQDVSNGFERQSRRYNRFLSTDVR